LGGHTAIKELVLLTILVLDLQMYVTDYEAVVKLSDGFNGADLRNVCTEAGLFAIRAEREYVIQEDFMKAVRKVADNKKLESKLDYKPV
jgi:26S proteasome regulatory subunit T4